MSALRHMSFDAIINLLKLVFILGSDLLSFQPRSDWFILCRSNSDLNIRICQADLEGNWKSNIKIKILDGQHNWNEDNDT